jgi:hypothetical protein
MGRPKWREKRLHVRFDLDTALFRRGETAPPLFRSRLSAPLGFMSRGRKGVLANTGRRPFVNGDAVKNLNPSLYI